MPATDANRENVVGQPPSADGNGKPGTLSSFWFLKKLSFSLVLSDPKKSVKMVCEVAEINEYVAQLSSKILWKCFAQISLLMDCA